MWKFLFIVCFSFIQGISVSQDLPGYNQMCSEYIENTVPAISVNELDSMLQYSSVILLDTRSKKEYNASHLKNAIWVGYDNFSMKSIENIAKDKTLVTYCSIGYRSEKIGELLQKNGYKSVYNLYGGIFSWGNNKLPLFDNNNRLVTIIHGYDSEWSKWVNTNINHVIIN